MAMEGTKSLDRGMKQVSTVGWSRFDEVLKVIYEGLAELNLQLPAPKRVDPSLGTVLFGAGSKLDSLGLANFIVITEQKLEDHLGFRVDLTQDDPFSPATGHFRTVHSLADYICALAKGQAEDSSI